LEALNKIKTENLKVKIANKATLLNSFYFSLLTFYFAYMIIPQTLKLETDKVILRPMQHSDIASFARLTNDASVWRYFTFLLNNSAELQRWVEVALKEREEGKRIPFTIIEKATGEICGQHKPWQYFLL
jgi:RimJ/RimL family protein N-acetyltransferase